MKLIPLLPVVPLVGCLRPTTVHGTPSVELRNRRDYYYTIRLDDLGVVSRRDLNGSPT